MLSQLVQKKKKKQLEGANGGEYEGDPSETKTFVENPVERGSLLGNIGPCHRIETRAV